MSASPPIRGVRDGEQRFTVRWVRLLFLCHFAIYVILLALFLLPASTRLLSIAFFGPTSLLAYRMIASATVVLDDHGAQVTPVLRRRRLAWSRIVEVGVTRGSSAFGSRFRVPYFKLDDGSVVTGQNVRSRRDNSVVDEVVAAARQHIPR